MSNYSSQLLEQLAKKGYKHKNIDKIFVQKLLQPVEVEIILKMLPKIYTEDIAAADTLVRSLISAAEPFDPLILIDLYENSDLNHYLKSGIGNTLSYAKTLDIAGWIRDQLLNLPFASERFSLLHGIYEKGKFINARELLDFLKAIFDKYHNGTVLKLFQKYGTEEDFEFLLEKEKTADKILAREINKAINKKRID